jgi:hypothetical protein
MIGRRLLPLVDSLGEPLAERTEEVSYLGLQSVDDEWHRPGLRRRYFKGHYLTELSDDAIEAFLSQGEPDPSADRTQLPNGSLQGYGGAIAATSNEDSAFSHRNTLVEFVGATAWTDRAEDDQRSERGASVRRGIEPFASGRVRQRLVRRGPGRLCVGSYPREGWTGSPRSSANTTPENIFHLNQKHSARRMTTLRRSAHTLTGRLWALIAQLRLAKPADSGSDLGLAAARVRAR